MKKLKLLCLVPAMCLGSCSSFQPYGVYEFRLGKTDGAHFGLSAELKEDANEKHEGTKQMSLAIDLGSEFDIDKIAEDYIEQYPYLEFLIKEILGLIPEDKTFPGYYSVTEYENKTYGKRVKIGSDYLLDTLEELYPQIEDLEDLSSLTAPEMVEMLACAYVNEKQFTLQIPVSKDDLVQQLAWYGYLIDFTGAKLVTELDTDKLPGPKGEERIGVHPTQVKDKDDNVVSDEVDEMNESFEFEFSRTFLYEEDEFGFKEPVCSFITRDNDKGQKVLYFDPFKDDMPSTNVKGKVLIKGLLLEEYKDIEFSFASNSKEATVNYNGKTGNDEGFTDAKGNEFKFKEFMQKEFVFRDFHDVKVGLTKI